MLKGFMGLVAVVGLLFAVVGSAATQVGASAARLDHVSVLVRNIDKAAQMLEDKFGWKRLPFEFGTDELAKLADPEKFAFVDANGLWIKLVQPKEPGPGADLIAKRMPGYYLSLNFAAGDFPASVGSLKSAGFALVDMVGQPSLDGATSAGWLSQGGKRMTLQQRLLSLPLESSRGTRIQLSSEPANGIAASRDRMWKAKARLPADGARVDHVVVLASDPDASASVFSKALGLTRDAETAGVQRAWLGVNVDKHVWLSDGHQGSRVEIIGPSADAPQTAATQYKDLPFMLTDGAVLELDVEVNDIEAFYDAFQQKSRLPLKAGDAKSLQPEQKFLTSDVPSMRYAYVPRNLIGGLRIMVFQRGTGAVTTASTAASAPRP